MQIENQLDDTLGVLVVGVKRAGSASEGGLGRGDVITTLNKESVASLTEFVALYDELKAAAEPRILLTVNRNGAVRYVLMKTDESEGEAPGE